MNQSLGGCITEKVAKAMNRGTASRLCSNQLVNFLQLFLDPGEKQVNLITHV